MNRRPSAASEKGEHMWSIFIVAMLATFGALFSGGHEREISTRLEDQRAMQLAESMALYREAVLRYFSVNSGQTSVSIANTDAQLLAMLPAWSSLQSAPASTPWRNYRDAAGIIYIYPAALPALNIQAELAQLSRNSHLVGSYRQSGMVLVSPVYGVTSISLASLAASGVPDGAPVWIGRIR
jgi:hypothetical protein